jgi:hypothetical protein
MADPRLLLQEAEHGTAELQRARQGALGDIRGREVLSPHAGGLAFHHLYGTQASDFRLPPKEGQVLTTPV